MHLLSRHTRPAAGSTLLALGVLAALALNDAPARRADVCAAPPAPMASAAPAAGVRHVATGEVERDGRCGTTSLPPAALAAAALAMLAVPRCRQGGVTEL